MSYISRWLKEKKISSSDILLGVFFIIIAAVIPLISRYTEVNVTDAELEALRSSSTVNDFFSYNKAFFIKLMGAFTFLFMLFQIISGDGFKIDFKKPHTIMMLVFAVLAIISAIASPYGGVSFSGISERYEGLWVILSYIVFFIVASDFAKSRERSVFLIFALCLSALLVGIVGLTQFFGHDILNTSFGSKLLFDDASQTISIKFDSVYATLYNPNCAGMFFGMMFSFLVLPAVLLPLKNKLKYVFTVLAVVTLVCLIGSNSVGGFMGAVAGTAFAVLTAVVSAIYKHRNTKTYIACFAGIVVFVVAIVALLNTDNMIARKVNVIVDTLRNGTDSESASYFKDFYVENNEAVVVTDGGNITIDDENGDLVLSLNGEKATPVSQTEESSTYELKDDIVWTLDSYTDAFMLTAEDKLGGTTSFIFAVDNGNVTLADKFGSAVTEEAESFGFEGVERLGSNRGYIWSRSIPLLAKNIFIGQGTDCFAFAFPQNDVRAKLRFLSNPYVIVDKPHNMYLQTGINTGVISLVITLAVFVLFIWQSFSVVKSKNYLLTAIRLGILGGCVAYMVAGLTTDSVVSVAPVFWVMLGTGFGLGYAEKSTEE
jgi:hypothetical protein